MNMELNNLQPLISNFVNDVDQYLSPISCTGIILQLKLPNKIWIVAGNAIMNKEYL